VTPKPSRRDGQATTAADENSASSSARGTKPRGGNAVAQRPVSDHDEREPACGVQELEDALLLRQPAGVEDERRLGLHPLRPFVDAVRNHAYV
jgi:hypothetical protein